MGAICRGVLPLLLVWAGNLHAAKLVNLSHAQIKDLQKQFAEAQPLDRHRLNSIVAAKSWSCELFGVRSRMQQTVAKQLYQFKPRAAGSIHSQPLHNEGSQIIKSYYLAEGELQGQHGPLKDVIRLVGKGKLVSELSVIDREPSESVEGEHLSAIDNKRPVITYSVCE